MIYFGLFAAFCGLVAADLAPAQDPVFKVTSDLVVVDAQVVSKKTGRTIGGLKRADFELYEDGVRQNIAFFSQNELPLCIVFLFDLTESVQPVLKPLASGALEALQHLKPEDETAVMVYSASARLVQDFTIDRALTVAAIEKASEMTSDEAAFFNEGVFQAARQSGSAKNPSSRRAIIWLTDNGPKLPSEWGQKHLGKGVPAGGLHTEMGAFQQLFETGTVVSSPAGAQRDVEHFHGAVHEKPLVRRRTQAPPAGRCVQVRRADGRAGDEIEQRGGGGEARGVD